MGVAPRAVQSEMLLLLRKNKKAVELLVFNELHSTAHAGYFFNQRWRGMGLVKTWQEQTQN